MRYHEVERSQPQQVADNIELVEMTPTHIDERLIPNRFYTHGLILGGLATALSGGVVMLSEAIGQTQIIISTFPEISTDKSGFLLKAGACALIAMCGLTAQGVGERRDKWAQYIKRTNSQPQTVFDGMEH